MRTSRSSHPYQPLQLLSSILLLSVNGPLRWENCYVQCFPILCFRAFACTSFHLVLFHLSDVFGEWWLVSVRETLHLFSPQSQGSILLTHGCHFLLLTFTRRATIFLNMQQVNGNAEYSVSVSASSTLGLLTEFAELDLLPPRPGYVVVRGSPLSGE